MTSPTIMDHRLLRTCEKRYVSDFAPSLWLNGASGIGVENGAAVPSWLSRDVAHDDFAQATEGSQPTYTAATRSVAFGGTDDFLAKASVTLTGATTSLAHFFAVVSTNVEDVEQVIYSQSDEASATRYLSLGISSGNKIHYKFNNAGTADELIGNLALGTGVHILEWAKIADAILMWVDFSPQTITVVGGGNNGKWFGDVTGADNSVIGAKVDDGGAEGFLTGSISELVALEPDDTEANVARLRRQLARLGGVTLATGVGLLLDDGSGITLDDGSGLLR